MPKRRDRDYIREAFWRAPQRRDRYILEAFAPHHIAWFNAERFDKEAGTTLDDVAARAIDGHRLSEGQESLKVLERRRTTYADHPAIELDTSYELYGQEARNYLVFIDGAYGIYELRGGMKKELDEPFRPIIKAIFSSFRELGPPTAVVPGNQ